MNTHLLASALSLVLAGAAQASFIDSFDGVSLHPDWTLVFRDDGASLSQSVMGGFLTVSSVGDSVSEDNGVWGVAALRRSITPISGDFSAAITFDWNQAGGVQAMEGLVLRLLDGSNEVVASVGYQDAWISSRGAYISTAGAVSGNTSLNAVPFSGSLSGAITRTSGTITTFRNAVPSAVGTSTAAIEAVEMEFRYFSYANSFFGTVNVDQVSVTAIPEPTTLATLAGVGALALAHIRRRRR